MSFVIQQVFGSDKTNYMSINFLRDLQVDKSYPFSFVLKRLMVWMKFCGILREERSPRKSWLSRAFLLFTDNATAKTVFHDSSCSSKMLFDLVLWITVVQIKYEIPLVHIAVTKTINQVADGLMRGILFQGVFWGSKMLTFISIITQPTHKHSLQYFLGLEYG